MHVGLESRSEPREAQVMCAPTSGFKARIRMPVLEIQLFPNYTATFFGARWYNTTHFIF